MTPANLAPYAAKTKKKPKLNFTRQSSPVAQKVDQSFEVKRSEHKVNFQTGKSRNFPIQLAESHDYGQVNKTVDTSASKLIKDTKEDLATVIDYKSKIRDRVRYLERSEELMKRKMRDQLYRSNKKAEID